MPNSLRILVIEDSAVHQQSARDTLKGYHLTIAQSYEEGFRILTPLGYDYVQKGEKGACFDVVLCDLLMPVSGTMMADPKKWEGVEMPIGWTLLLRAVLNGTRYGALVSMGNHHDHPVAYAMEGVDNRDDSWGDKLSVHEPQLTKKAQFVINGARVGVFGHPPTVLVPGFSNCAWKCDKGQMHGEPCSMCEGTGLARGKDWGLVLKVLLEG